MLTINTMHNVSASMYALQTAINCAKRLIAWLGVSETHIMGYGM